MKLNVVISLANHNGPYTNNDIIVGVATLSVVEDIQVTSIEVLLQGVIEIDYKRGNDSNRVKTVFLESQKHVFPDKQLLFLKDPANRDTTGGGSTIDYTLPQGDYSYPFSFQLPDSSEFYPPSLHCKPPKLSHFALVRYSIVAVVHRPGFYRPNLITYNSFRFQPHYTSLSYDPLLLVYSKKKIPIGNISHGNPSKLAINDAGLLKRVLTPRATLVPLSLTAVFKPYIENSHLTQVEEHTKYRFIPMKARLHRCLDLKIIIPMSYHALQSMIEAGSTRITLTRMNIQVRQTVGYGQSTGVIAYHTKVVNKRLNQILDLCRDFQLIPREDFPLLGTLKNIGIPFFGTGKSLDSLLLENLDSWPERPPEYLAEKSPEHLADKPPGYFTETTHEEKNTFLSFTLLPECYDGIITTHHRLCSYKGLCIKHELYIALTIRSPNGRELELVCMSPVVMLASGWEKKGGNIQHQKW